MKKIIIILTIIGLLALAGCDGSSGDTTTTSKTKPFLGGTRGLTIDFEEDAPPDEVFDRGEYPFDISVKLENMGESEVKAADCKVTLSGISPADFSKNEGDFIKNPDSDLGKRYKDSEGNIIEEDTLAYAEILGLNYKGELQGNKAYPVRVDVCYKYKTYAMSELCLREDILDQQEEGACKVNEAKTVYNSGAPIQITDFKEVPGGSDNVRFTFTIKHMGTGDFFEPGSWCDSTGVTHEDKVYVKVDTGMSGLECNSLDKGTEGLVSVRGGDRAITCTQKANVQVDQIKTVDIELEYDYEEDKSTEILVKHHIS